MAEFLSLHDAVARYVQDGATVTMEGFTHLIPFAAGHEVIRQKKRDLTLIRMTPDIIYDQMIGAGCAKKVIFSWGGNPKYSLRAAWSGTQGLAPISDLVLTKFQSQKELNFHQTLLGERLQLEGGLSQR